MPHYNSHYTVAGLLKDQTHAREKSRRRLVHGPFTFLIETLMLTKNIFKTLCFAFMS